MTPPTSNSWFRPSGITRRPGLLENGALVIVALIVIVDAITIPTGGGLKELSSLGVEGWRPGGYIALAVAVVGVILARWRPWPGMVLVAAAPVASALMGWDPIATWNVAIFATFWATLTALPALPMGILVGGANYLAVSIASGFSLENAVATIAGLAALAAAATGGALKEHRRYWAELEAHAREAIAARDAEAQRAVAQERVRIARDLHDVVGHEVALVSMHLGAAEVHLSDPDAALTDLHEARGGVQRVLAGTQQILNVLRVSGEDETTMPAADYAAIVGLVDSFRVAGLEVTATLAPATDLSPAVSAATYRIVQEALTNAQRYGAGTIELTVAVEATRVSIEAVNPVRPTTSKDGERSGYGLVGMRERAESVGGRIETRLADNLFSLHATLPTNGERR